MERKRIVGFLGIAMFTFMLFAGSTNAYIPPNTTDGTAVAIVDGFYGTGGGSLAYTDSAFDPFNFTIVPLADVNAANLTQFQIVVLNVHSAPECGLNEQQRIDLVAWVNNGGKLIIYNSETGAVNYTWLPYPFTSDAPGQMGAGGTIVFKEDNSLGSTNPVSPIYLDTASITSGTDAIGDSQVVITLDPNWCGDLLVINYLSNQNWTRMYAQYGNGLFIYNGIDLDNCGSGTTPSSTGAGALARMFLLELLQPWGTDYNLPCGSPLVEKENPVGGIVISPALMQPAIMAILIAACIVVVATLYRKNSLRAFQ